MSLRLIEVFAELEVSATNRRKAASGATPVK